MSTVLWHARSRTLAADTRVTVGKKAQPGRGVRKVYRVRGHLLGFAGDVAACVRWLEWFRDGGSRRRPSLKEIDVIEVRPDGHVYVHSHGRRAKLVMRHASIGSGRNFAMAALLAGAAPRKAVQIAATFDRATGGRVQCLRLPRK